MSDVAALVLHNTALVVGYCGAAVILWGVALTFVRFVRCEVRRLRRRDTDRAREALRHQLGGYLLLGLELLIAADVLETIIHPTLLEIGLLGGIVVIRTVIGFFLDREIATFHRSGEPDA